MNKTGSKESWLLLVPRLICGQLLYLAPILIVAAAASTIALGTKHNMEC